MRDLTGIVIHCSATKEGQDISAADIRKWHVEERGWQDIGYHFVVRLDGSVETGRPIATAGAHVSGHNATTIGICYVGGLDNRSQPKDTRTPAQRIALRTLVDTLKHAYPSVREVKGHRDFPGVLKACPCFDVQTEL